MGDISAGDQPAFVKPSVGAHHALNFSKKQVNPMVEITPAPEHKVTLADNTRYLEITCPFCLEKYRFPDDQRYAVVQAVCKCKPDKVVLMNGYAFTGIDEYLSNEAASKRPGGRLG